jgi:phosphatidylserine decarboxylase
VTFVREGEEVAAGQRIGVIRFGSQVDVVLPLRSDLTVLVAPGDRVIAGETPIAELERVAAHAPPESSALSSA